MRGHAGDGQVQEGGCWARGREHGPGRARSFLVPALKGTHPAPSPRTPSLPHPHSEGLSWGTASGSLCVACATGRLHAVWEPAHSEPLQQMALQRQPRATDTQQSTCPGKGDGAAANTATPVCHAAPLCHAAPVCHAVHVSRKKPGRADTARNSEEVRGSDLVCFLFFWWVFYFLFFYLLVVMVRIVPPPKKKSCVGVLPPSTTPRDFIGGGILTQ